MCLSTRIITKWSASKHTTHYDSCFRLHTKLSGNGLSSKQRETSMSLEPPTTMSLLRDMNQAETNDERQHYRERLERCHLQKEERHCRILEKTFAFIPSIALVLYYQTPIQRCNSFKEGKGQKKHVRCSNFTIREKVRKAM